MTVQINWCDKWDFCLMFESSFKIVFCLFFRLFVCTTHNWKTCIWIILNFWQYHSSGIFWNGFPCFPNLPLKGTSSVYCIGLAENGYKFTAKRVTDFHLRNRRNWSISLAKSRILDKKSNLLLQKSTKISTLSNFSTKNFIYSDKKSNVISKLSIFSTKSLILLHYVMCVRSNTNCLMYLIYKYI